MLRVRVDFQKTKTPLCGVVDTLCGKKSWEK